MTTVVARAMKKIVGFIIVIAFATLSKAETCWQAQSVRQVVILPPTGGANSADRSLFNSLCKRGHEVTLLDYEQESGLTTDLGIHDQISRSQQH